jgi:hypothetical protein
MRLRTESREQRAIVSGVKAYARAPTRSAKPPRPERVLDKSLSLMGVTHVLYVMPTKLKKENKKSQRLSPRSIRGFERDREDRNTYEKTIK